MRPEREQELRELAKKNTPQGKLAKEIFDHVDEVVFTSVRVGGELHDALKEARDKAENVGSLPRELAVAKDALRRAVDDIALLTRSDDTAVIMNEYLDAAERELPR